MEKKEPEIFSKYPECRKQFQDMTLNMLCDFEDDIAKAKEYFGVVGCEINMSRAEMLELIGETIKEKTAGEHDKLMVLYQRSLKEILTPEEHRWIFLHRNRCEKCKQETRLNRLKARIGSSGGSTPKSIKIRDINNNSNQKKPNIFVSKIAEIKKQLSSINVRNIKTIAKKRTVVVASIIVSVIVAVLTVSVLIRNYNAKKIDLAKTAQQDRGARKEFQVKKRRTSQEIMRYAQQYEDASRKLKKQPQDPISLLARGEAAEELNLLGKALEDYQSYLKLATDVSSRAIAEGKVTKLQAAINTPIKPEATYYEEFNSFLNSYLLSLIEGKSTRAQDELETAQAVAKLMLKNTGDRVGVDQIEFYSKLSVDTAKELLEARLETEEVSKVVAIDHFQDSIDKLYKVKNVFVRHGADIENQSVAVLLAKFLSKAGRLAEARTKVDQWLAVSKNESYLFNQAQLLFWDGQMNVYERKEQEAVRKFQRSIEIYQSIDDDKFILYPIMLLSYLYNIADKNELALSKSMEGVVGSLKYNHAAFSSQFLQEAGIAAAGLNMPNLAKIYLESSIKACEKEELWGYRIVAKAALSSVLAMMGEKQKAIDLINEAKTLDLGKSFDPTAKQQQLLHVISYEGKVYGLAKDFVKSERAYREAISLSKELGYKNILVIGQWRKGLGEALLEQKRNEEALQEFKLAEEEFRKVSEGLHPESKNRLLDRSFSGKEIDELIKLVQP
ncbi:MAG: hypothetical protein JNN15_01145 [Blastocatellia bacterium]|nr:hypothetical protein [Blastocatellia bacterium]